MAITILEKPQLYQTVYNPIYTKVASDKTGQEAHNFIFDIYVDGNYITRDRLLSRPGTNEAIYSPARILESYLSFDKSHNITGTTASQNCILNYEIKYGEEYIDPFNFYDNTFTTGIYSGYTTFYSTGDTNSFISGDKVYVVQDPGFSNPAYNGVFTVLSATSTSVTVDIGHTSTPVNGGLIYYSDKRKTVFLGEEEQIINPTFQYNAGNTSWTSDSALGCASYFKVTSFNKLQFVMPDVTCQNTFTIQYTGGTFSPGATYTIEFTVDTLTNPSSAVQYVEANLGGTTASSFNGLGTYSTSLVCGPTGILELTGYFDADTAGFGSHSFSLSNISVKSPTQFSAYTFNGVLQYEEIPTWTYLPYYMKSGGKYLTNQPLTVKTKLCERGSIGWLNVSPSPTSQYYMFVVVTRFDGLPTIPLQFSIPQMTGSSTEDRIIELGVYPWNLNILSQALFLTDVVDYQIKSYQIILAELPDPIGDPDAYVQIAETRTFELDTNCSKYADVRFMFLNTLGQFDFFTANLLSRENININRTTYKKNLAYNYAVGDRGKSVISLDGQQTYTVTSNWITEDTCTWLMELFLSQEVYILNADGSITPITVDNTAVEPKKRVNDGLLNYTFNYSKAVLKNTARN